MTKTATDAPVPVSGARFRELVGTCEVLVLAAGFEARARRVLELAKGRVPKRVVAVCYPQGNISQNDDTLEYMTTALGDSGAEVAQVTLDAARPDAYCDQLRRVLRNWRPDAVGEVWVDISALPMQGICATLATVREVMPGVVCRVLYTEAAEYYPTAQQVTGGGGAEGTLTALSKEMSTNLIPKRFGGASSDVLTCLIVFAGYEAHRSFGVVDELNPSKLVLVYGRPVRDDLEWRLAWSRKIHDELKKARPTAEEVVSTLDPTESLALLSRYYDYLFADHNLAVSPICSKMQCVGCYLFWERFRDVQLVFPLPITYLPKEFSSEYGQTFLFELPRTADIAGMVRSAFDP